MKSWIRGLFIVSCAIATAHHAAHGQAASPSAAPAPATSSGDLDEIVVNGIKRGELILPTQVTSASAYGLDLGVMDTPRNNTLLSKAQLDALKVQNPGGLSYLTSSSYSDASFGEPNIPRIRGQYADMFFNGMRDSFTLNGYGAPISFNSVDSIDIVKGPASVQGGGGGGRLDRHYHQDAEFQQIRGRIQPRVRHPAEAARVLRCGRAADLQYGRTRELRLRRQRQLLLRHVFPSAVAVCLGDHQCYR